MPPHLEELVPGRRLASLIAACEKNCVAGCCGIDAFDFSPLHIASHLSAFTGAISASDVDSVRSELAALLERAAALEPDSDGLACTVAGMNQCFTMEALQRLGDEIALGLELAPRVLEFSEELRRKGV